MKTFMEKKSQNDGLKKSLHGKISKNGNVFIICHTPLPTTGL